MTKSQIIGITISAIGVMITAVIICHIPKLLTRLKPKKQTDSEFFCNHFKQPHKSPSLRIQQVQNAYAASLHLKTLQLILPQFDPSPIRNLTKIIKHYRNLTLVLNLSNHTNNENTIDIYVYNPSPNRLTSHLFPSYAYHAAHLHVLPSKILPQNFCRPGNWQNVINSSPEPPTPSAGTNDHTTELHLTSEIPTPSILSQNLKPPKDETNFS